MRNNNDCVNKVILLGTINKEPRWHEKNHERWLHVSLVTREAVFSSSGDFEHLETHQVRISALNPNANRWQLKTGDVLYIQGKIATEIFIDEQNIKRYKTEVIVQAFEKFGADNVKAQ